LLTDEFLLRLAVIAARCPFDPISTRRRRESARWEGIPVLRRYRSDDWFSKDGIDGVGISYSSFMPSRENLEMLWFTGCY